ncbi:MAG: winged helix-turn-helix transcriptional regulator [Verrucomicrobiae bacterium]|nr:winged helix-turn-helix transcriptional regulator [Verrucomicrobiae bacterium]
MKSRLLRRVAKSQKYQILCAIKKSNGLSVAELCQKVGLSYMGVKQHCIALEKDGYLDCWRRPKGMGRPEKAYRLTPLAQEFFPTFYTEFTTEILLASTKMFGPNAAERILFVIYQGYAENYLKRIKAQDIAQRITEFAEMRDLDGYMSEVLINQENNSVEIVEFNSPVLEIAEQYPIVKNLEQQLFQKVLGYPIIRNEERTSGLYRCSFQVEIPAQDFESVAARSRVAAA